TEDEEVIVWQSEWDSTDDAAEFGMALAARESTRLDADAEDDGNTFSIVADDVLVEIAVDGTSVTYIQAPDEATLDVVLAD
ncbi:MAG: hypothetical protein H0T72_04630, partial [Chloroflexia bacterium]|nr:hypothetical protein [Chloroflexia bacterium]